MSIDTIPTTDRRLPRYRMRLLTCGDRWEAAVFLKGLGIPLEVPEIRDAFLAWGAAQNKEAFTPGGVRRNDLEFFLRDFQLCTVEQAAAEMAITEDSVPRIIAEAERRGILQPGEARNCMSDKRIVRSDLFEVLLRRICGDASGSLPAVHEMLRSRLGTQVEHVYCPVAEALGRKEYANTLDVLTRQAFNRRYAVTLDTGKPAQLPPDVCSWKTLAEFETQIHDCMRLQVNDADGYYACRAKFAKDAPVLAAGSRVELTQEVRLALPGGPVIRLAPGVRGELTTILNDARCQLKISGPGDEWSVSAEVPITSIKSL